MKPLVLFSVLFAGVFNHSANAAQPNYMHSATSSAASTVSIVKTDSIKFSLSQKQFTTLLLQETTLTH